MKRNPFSDEKIDEVNGAVSGLEAAKTLQDVVTKDPLRRAQQTLQKFEPQIDSLALEVKQIEVRDDGTAALMTSKIGLARQVIKALDEERKLIIAEPDKFVRSINANVRFMRERLESVLKIGEPKLRTYTYQLELKRREDERRMQDEIARRQAAMDKAAKKAGVETVQLPDAVLPVERERITTDEASVTYKPVWVGVITDPQAVPREYCEPSQKLIDQAVNSGIRKMPGVEIKEQMKSVWRTR